MPIVMALSLAKTANAQPLQLFMCRFLQLVADIATCIVRAKLTTHELVWW